MINVIFNLLTREHWNGYVVPLAKNLDINSAVLYQYLVGAQKYFEGRGELNKGFFFATSKIIFDKIGLTEHSQKTCIKKLVSAGLIEYKLMSLPAKGHFKILEDIEVLAKLLSDNAETSSEESAELVIDNPQDIVPRNPENIYNTNINTKNNTNTSPTAVSHHKGGNFFSQILEDGVTKQDTNKTLEYREQKKLNDEKKKLERDQKKKQLSDQFNSKMQNKDFNSFTYDDIVSYYEDKLQKKYGPVHKIANAAKFRDALTIKVPEWGFSSEQVIGIIDVYLDKYVDLKGVDATKYPIPKFPMNLITNPGIIAQVTSAYDYVSRYGPTSSTESTMNIKADPNMKLIPMFEKEWEEIEDKWAKKWEIIIFNEKGKMDQRLVNWMDDYRVAEELYNWLARGYDREPLAEMLKLRDEDLVTEYWFSKLEPALKEREKLVVQLHRKHIKDWDGALYVGH